jgi:hypothetical protein
MRRLESSAVREGAKMKRIIAAVATVLATGLLAGGAGASGGLIGTAATGAKSLAPNSGADVYGVGGGKVDGGFQSFNLSAHEGPNGDFGHVSVTFTNLLLGQTIVSYSVNVTCVHIHTLTSNTFDRGVITGTVKSVTPVPNLVGLRVGDSVDFGIKDGGNPSSGPVDDFYAPNAGASTTLSCKSFFYTGALANVTQGNVNIKGP